MARKKMTKDEALAVLPRRLRRWKQLSDAIEQLKAKLKPVVGEIKTAVGVVPGKQFEGAGVKAKWVDVESVNKSDDGNLALVASKVRADELDVICPRTIDVKQLESRYPEIVEDLSTKSTKRCEIDLLQVDMPKSA